MWILLEYLSVKCRGATTKWIATFCAIPKTSLSISPPSVREQVVNNLTQLRHEYSTWDVVVVEDSHCWSG